MLRQVNKFGTSKSGNPQIPVDRSKRFQFHRLNREESKQHYLETARDLNQLPLYSIQLARLSTLSYEAMERIAETVIIPGATGDEGTINDPLMGNNLGVKCSRCKQIECAGHSGLLRFSPDSSVMIYNISFIPDIISVLNCCCRNCHNLMLSPKEMADMGLFSISGTSRLRQLEVRCKRLLCRGDRTCEDKHGNILPCGDKYNYLQKESMKIGRLLYREKGSQTKFVHEISKVFEILDSLSTDASLLLGFPEDSHPRDMILRGLLITPPRIRGAEFVNGKVKQDKTTLLLEKIVQKVYQISQLRAEKKSISTAVDDLYELNKALTWKSERANGTEQQFHSYKDQIQGKDGLLRNDMFGSRRDYGMRSVAGPGDPSLKFGQIGLPGSQVATLTHQEWVTDHNKYYIQALYDAGKIPYYSPFGTNTRFDIRGGKGHVFQIGDKVERFLQTGDIVLSNRQPSLHRHSTMCYEVILHDASTNTYPGPVTSPHNLDFDGDETNVLLLRSTMARAQAYFIAAVRRNLISAHQSKPVMGLVQDAVIGAFLLSLREEPLDPRRWWELVQMITLQKDVDTLVQRVISKGIHPLSGRALVSALFPSNFRYQYEGVLIEDGVLIKGLLEKKHIGPVSQGIVHVLYKEYSPERASVFINDGTAMLTDFTSQELFSVGITDFTELFLVNDKGKIVRAPNVNQIMKELKTLPDVVFARNLSEVEGIVSNNSYAIGVLNSKSENVRTVQIDKLSPGDLGYALGKLHIIVGKGLDSVISIKSETLIKILSKRNGITLNPTEMKWNEMLFAWPDAKIVLVLPPENSETYGYLCDFLQETYTGQDIRKDIEALKKTTFEEIRDEVDQIRIRAGPNKDKDFTESLIIHAVRKAADLGPKILNSSLPASNSLGIMVKSGAKGSTESAALSVVTLGQQFHHGEKRITPGISGDKRCLPSQQIPNDDYEADPCDRGMCTNSYMTGLSPEELHHATKSGREGLLNITFVVPEVGDMQRKLTATLASLIIGQDGSVRNNAGVLIQTLYGYAPEELIPVTTSQGTFFSPIDIRALFTKLNSIAGWELIRNEKFKKLQVEVDELFNKPNVEVLRELLQKINTFAEELKVAEKIEPITRNISSAGDEDLESEIRKLSDVVSDLTVGLSEDVREQMQHVSSEVNRKEKLAEDAKQILAERRELLWDRISELLGIQTDNTREQDKLIDKALSQIAAKKERGNERDQDILKTLEKYNRILEKTKNPVVKKQLENTIDLLNLSLGKLTQTELEILQDAEYLQPSPEMLNALVFQEQYERLQNPIVLEKPIIAPPTREISVLSNFELSTIIGRRGQMLEHNATPLVHTRETDPMKIAIEEYESGKLGKPEEGSDNMGMYVVRVWPQGPNGRKKVRVWASPQGEQEELL